MANIHLRQADTERMSSALAEAHRIFREIGAPDEELELAGFDLYEISVLHPECAPAAWVFHPWRSEAFLVFRMMWNDHGP